MRRRRIVRPDAEDILIDRIPVEDRKVVGIEIELQVALIGLAPAHLELNVELLGHGHLHEGIVDVVIDVVIAAESFRFVMELADAVGQAPLDPGQHDLVAEGPVVAADAGGVELHAVTLEQRRELVERGLGRPYAGDDIEVGLGQLRLHRVDADRLQKL